MKSGAMFTSYRIRSFTVIAVILVLGAFIENRAQKRGGCGIEHEMPP